jgi:hypothetical protein
MVMTTGMISIWMAITWGAEVAAAGTHESS